MVRYLLLFLLVILIARAVWRLIGGVIAGWQGLAARAPAAAFRRRGVQMVRDPVCGTFVLPDRALSLTDGSASAVLLLRRLPRPVSSPALDRTA